MTPPTRSTDLEQTAPPGSATENARRPTTRPTEPGSPTAQAPTVDGSTETDDRLPHRVTAAWSTRQRRRRTLAASVILAPIVLALAVWGFARDPASVDLTIGLAAPSWGAPLGTDHLGRDVLARLIHGTGVTLGLTTLAVTLNAGIGTALGFVAARNRTVLSGAILRTIDVAVAVPMIVIGLMLAAIMRPGVTTLLLAAMLAGWTPFARLAYGLADRVGTGTWVEAAILSGAREPRIVLKHILPNVARPLVVHAFLRFTNTLLNLAGLSYLGLGLQPPSSEWGVMLAQGQPYLERRPLLVIAPAAAIVATAIGVSAIGRALERRWDRRHR